MLTYRYSPEYAIVLGYVIFFSLVILQYVYIARDVAKNDYRIAGGKNRKKNTVFLAYLPTFIYPGTHTKYIQTDYDTA